MKPFMLMSTIFSSISFIFLTHPVSLIILILTQSIMICLMIFTLLHLSWFAIMLFLIFMGGLMILFLYIASLASNEKFEPNVSLMISATSISLIILFLSPVLNTQGIFTQESLNFKPSIFLVYSMNMIKPTIISMVYLLITLLITVNIVKLYEAPIRSMV